MGIAGNLDLPDERPLEADRHERRRDWRALFPDPRIVGLVLYRHLRLFLVVLVTIVGAVALWTATRTPSYKAAASLVVKPQTKKVVDLEAVTPGLSENTFVVDTQVKLMQSPAVARLVAERYAAMNPRDPLVRGSDVAQLAGVLSAATIIARSASTYVIEVTSRAENPRQAAEVANLFVTLFVNKDLSTKVNANLSARNWLATRTAELSQQATEADAALQAYKIRNGLISSEGQNLSEQEISTLNTQIAQARAELAEKRGRRAAAGLQLTRGSGGADVGAALGSGTIGTLRASEAVASGKVAQLETRFGPEYPDLASARSELTSIRGEIQLEINRILSNLDAEVQVAASRLSSLEASRNRSTSVLAANNGAQVGLGQLQRRADAAKAIYETFLNRSRETSAQQGLQQADTQVDSLAEVPQEPEFPNRQLAAFLGVLGGLVAAFGAVGIAELGRGTLRTREDVEDRLGLRYAGALPTLASTLDKGTGPDQPSDYIIARPFSVFAESVRSLQAFLLLGSDKARGEVRATAIVSALPREGKTTTALCLARTAARSGLPTVLVDCDLRRRGSSQALRNTKSNGLYDYFDGGDLEKALFLDETSGLFLLGTAQAQPDARDPLTTENITRLLRDLKKEFKVIIIDTSPLLGVADSRIVASAADQALLISRWNDTPLRASEAAADLLISAGAKVAGVALSQVDVRKFASTGLSDMPNYRGKFQSYYVN